MFTTRRRAPFWFLVLLAVVEGLSWRLLGGLSHADGVGGGQQLEVRYAFWGFLVIIGELIWKGLEVAGKISLQVLHWMVVNLSLVVTKIGNGLKAVGSALLLAGRKTWEFFQLTYEKVLKPAWGKFWRWFDRFRKWLDTTFGPILKWLRRLRDTLLDFWKRYVRPWLDLIDVTRRALRVLNSLGLKWAGALDAKLAELEDRIERPFRLLLAKVNEIINIVNRVVTLDGLLQRVALIKSIARDYRFVWDSITKPFRKAPTDADREKTRSVVGSRTLDQATKDFPIAVVELGGPHRALISEMQVQWRNYLTRRP